MRLAAVLLLGSAWAALAQTPPPPSPARHFGHELTEDRKLLDWDKVVSYFETLARTSPRLKMEVLGRSVGGRPFIAAWIASPETLAQLAAYRNIQEKLADPRITPEAQAEALAARGKAVVMITCSIHSTEVASTHTAALFAHRMLTDESARYRAIRENVIFILVPSLNPDGVDLVTAWYRRTLGTPFEGTSPPELYHKYLGHDNNRDWYIFSQPETRLTISKLHNQWHPQIVYDVHQQSENGSRMFVPPWLDPIEPNVDPLLVQQMNLFGLGIATDLTAAGKTGVVVNASYDFWTPARAYQAFHGGLRVLTETASARLASPVTVPAERLENRALGYDPRRRSWNHVEPWPGGEWRLKDIIEYQLIAFESVLYQAALRREDLLRNFYRIHQRQIARKRPYAFVIPAAQRDPGATKRLIDTLAFGGVEVEIETDGGHRIRMEQPYSGWAKALLERQEYPDLREYPGGPPRRPYDVTAHTLPLLMGVDVRVQDRPFAVGAVAARAQRRDRLSASDTDSWPAINRIWNSGGVVWRDPRTGDFSPSQLDENWVALRRPRLGLYRSHLPQIDEGWTRWILEQMGFSYSSVRNADIRAGGLRKHFDVVLFPDQSSESIELGYRPGAMPEEFCGGLEEEGARALREFASAGGTLIFLNRSTEYAVRHLGVAAKNVLEGVSSKDFYAPGSLLWVNLDPGHPLAFGLPERIPIWSERSPAWETGETVAARYVSFDLLASGWLLGERRIVGKAALVDARLGQGRVILMGMRPQYRGQSYQALKLLFNAFFLP